MKSLQRISKRSRNWLSLACRRRSCGACNRICCNKKRIRCIEDLIIDVLDFTINKGMRVLGPVLAVAATLLISLVVYEYFKEVFPNLQIKYNDTNPFMPYIITICGVFILINVFFNHQSCVWTSPGFAPLSINLYPKGTQEIPSKFYKYDPELKAHDLIRYCNQCNTYKPWRAHHCSICKRCVLKMDHHCPWMWNCVGYANYRYFYMFLFYLWIGTLFYIMVGYEALFQSFRIKSCAYPWLPFFFCRIARIRHKIIDNETTPIQRNELFVFTYFLCIGIFIVMIAFLGFHSYLVITNQSTLETMTNFSASTRKYRRFQRLRDIKYLYKLSFIENIKEILGDKPYMALLPIWTKPRGNGFIYPLPKEVNHIVSTSNVTIDNDTNIENSNMTLP